MAIIEITDVGSYGLSASPATHELPPGMWTRAQNVRFTGLSVEKMTGQEQTFGTLPPGGKPLYFIQTISPNGRPYWVYCSRQKIFVTDGTFHVDITKYTTNPGDFNYTASIENGWSGTLFFGIPILNNGTDVPQYWPDWNMGGSTFCQDLPGFAAVYNRCSVVRAFKNFLVALGVTEGGTYYPYLTAWSDIAAPGSLPTDWDYTSATNKAGQSPLADTGGELVDAHTLGDALLIYKRGAIEGMSYIGGGPVMAFRRLSETIGALAVNCITVVQAQHVVMGQGDIVLTNGSSVESILDQNQRARRLRTWFFQQIDPDKYRQSFVVRNSAKNEVWFCIPEQGQIFSTLALVWNYKENTFGVRDLSARGEIGYYLTTKVYPVVDIAEMEPKSFGLDEAPSYGVIDSMEPTSIGISTGKFGEPLLTYTDWPAEELELKTISLSAGVYNTQLLVYENWPPEELEAKTVVLASGRYHNAFIAYTNWPAEEMELQSIELSAGVYDTP